MKNYKKEDGISYALGMTVVFELIKNKCAFARKVYIHPETERNENYKKLIKLCAEAKIPVETDAKPFNILSKKENCFVIGEFIKYKTPLNAKSNHLVLVNPSNAGNLGTIMRTALGFGFNDLAIITPAVDYFSPPAVRSSMGAVFSLNIKEYKNIESYIAENPAHKHFPFMLDASTNIEKVHFQPPFSLIFGNEAHGLPADFSKIGQSVIIPHSDKIDSLNLSIAVGIAAFFSTSGKIGK